MLFFIDIQSFLTHLQSNEGPMRKKDIAPLLFLCSSKWIFNLKIRKNNNEN